jgi:hypothetical protein
MCVCVCVRVCVCVCVCVWRMPTLTRRDHTCELQEWRRIKDQVLADQSLDDAQRRDRLLALDTNLCMFENAAGEQV